MSDVTDDSALCPLWGVLVENTDMAAGTPGIPGAVDTLGLGPPGQGLKRMWTAPEGPAARSSTSEKERKRHSAARAHPTPGHAGEQMQEPSE